MNVLMTGGSGLVGSRLAPMLAERHELTHFDRADPGDGRPWVDGDLLDPAAVAEACAGQEAVIALAAIHGANWRALGDHAMFEINVMGLHNLLEGAARAGVRRFVFTSSISAIGHGAGTPPPYLPIDEALPRGPADLYGHSKAVGEQLCAWAAARYGLSVIVLRPGFICPEDVAFERTLDYLFFMVEVRDVARAHLLALEADPAMRHETCLITADSPLARISPLQYFADPTGTLERLYPGIGCHLEDGSLAPPRGREWYTIERARAVLGFEPEHGFALPKG